MSNPDRSRGYRGGRGSRGLAIVEFAITVPLILFVFIAVAELGRAFYQYTALTKSVRDGARLLATFGSGSAGGIGVITLDEQNAVRRLVATGTVAGDGVPILPGFQIGDVDPPVWGTAANVRDPATGAIDPDYVRVTATYQFQPLFAGIPTFGFGSGDIAVPVRFTATAVQRSLRS